jgi:hypothetical protein
MIRGGSRKMENLGIGEKKDPVLIREPTIKPFSEIFPPLSFIVPGERIVKIAEVYKTIRLNKIQKYCCEMQIQGFVDHQISQQKRELH